MSPPSILSILIWHYPVFIFTFDILEYEGDGVDIFVQIDIDILIDNIEISVILFTGRCVSATSTNHKRLLSLTFIHFIDNFTRPFDWISLLKVLSDLLNFVILDL